MAKYTTSLYLPGIGNYNYGFEGDLNQANNELRNVLSRNGGKVPQNLPDNAAILYKSFLARPGTTEAGAADMALRLANPAGGYTFAGETKGAGAASGGAASAGVTSGSAAPAGTNPAIAAAPGGANAYEQAFKLASSTGGKYDNLNLEQLHDEERALWNRVYGTYGANGNLRASETTQPLTVEQVQNLDATFNQAMQEITARRDAINAAADQLANAGRGPDELWGAPYGGWRAPTSPY